MTHRGDTGRTAVLLNAHAKRVTERVRDEAAQEAGFDNVFLSRDLHDANRIARKVVAEGYATVLAAGGDGTFAGWVHRISIEAGRQGRPLPRFGILALGTGNAVAGLVGASAGGWREDLRRVLRGAAPGSRRLDLVDCEGRHTPFAGAGADAALIHDYDWLRTRLRGTPLHALGHGPPGFALAAALRTVPRQLFHPQVRCEVVCEGGRGWRLDAEGNRVGGSVARGEVIYAGPCLLAAASTVPYYGLGMRAFPFAGDEPGCLHLRIASEIPVPSVLLNLPRIWTGAFRHPGLHDFLVEGATVRFDQPMPIQLGGDAGGLRERVTMGVAAQPIDLVDFKAGQRA